MKNVLRMPNVKNVKGIENDTVKAVFKMLSSENATIHEEIKDRSVKVVIENDNYKVVFSSSIPKTAVEIMHYGYRSFSCWIYTQDGIKLQGHSDLGQEAVRCIGKLIDDVYDMNAKDDSKEAYEKFESFLND